MTENSVFKNKIRDLFHGHRLLLCFIFGAFLISLAYSFYFRITPAVDARAYDVIAMNIVQGYGYRENPSVDIINDYAIARVGPVYEYFLAGLYAVFGHHYEAVWVAQALLRGLTVWLVYLIALLIFADDDKKKQIGLWSAAIIAFYPDLIEISAMLMIETLYLFFLCLMLYLFFLAARQRASWLIAALGGLAGLAVLTRPPALFLIPLFWFYFWRQKRWPAIFLSALVLLAVFVPWTWRNWQTYDQIMPFGAAGNFNFWIGNYHGGNGEQVPTQEHIEFSAKHGVREINGESMKQFKTFLRQYPGEFAKLTLLRVSKYFSVVRPMGFWFYQKGLGQFIFILSSAAASVFLFILSLGGILKTVATKDKRLYYWLALTVMTPAIVFITVVETRYRFPIYPLLAVFAGYFIVSLAGSSRWWREKQLWLAAALIFSNGLVDLLLSANLIKERLGVFLKWF